MEYHEAISLWLTATEAAGRSPYTIAAYRSQIGPFLRFLDGHNLKDVEDITVFHLRSFLTEYARSHAPESAKSVYHTVRIWLRWLASEGILTASPTDRVKAPKAPETTKATYSQGQVRTMLKALSADKTPLGLRNSALLSCLLETGARASEALATTIDDITDDGLLLRRTKAKRPRLAPMGDNARRALAMYLTRGRPKLRPKGNWLFVAEDGAPLSRNGMNCMLKRLRGKVGFAVSAHRCRHTAATNWLKNGLDLETVRKLGGWATYVSLKPYLHLTDADLQRAASRASILDNLR